MGIGRKASRSACRAAPAAAFRQWRTGERSRENTGQVSARSPTSSSLVVLDFLNDHAAGDQVASTGGRSHFTATFGARQRATWDAIEAADASIKARVLEALRDQLPPAERAL
jgi:hypothetical protein